jgi:hypothetical protein
MSYEIGDDSDLLVGDEIESLLSGYEIGAVKPMRAIATRSARPAVARASALSNALAARQAATSTLVRQSSPVKGRHYVLGFDSVANVAAGAALAIVQQPQVIFRPERVVVPASIAPNFLILDLRVGKNSQFASANAVPAEMFSQTAFGVDLKCDTAQVSQVITMNVQNISAAAVRFIAAISGEAVE